MSARIVGYDTLMNVTTVAMNGTGYTSSMKFERCTETVCVFLVSTAGSITVTQQCSLDDSNWYDPINAAAKRFGEGYNDNDRHDRESGFLTVLFSHRISDSK